jgi:hypothetical protein
VEVLLYIKAILKKFIMRGSNFILFLKYQGDLLEFHHDQNFIISIPRAYTFSPDGALEIFGPDSEQLYEACQPRYSDPFRFCQASLEAENRGSAGH